MKHTKLTGFIKLKNKKSRKKQIVIRRKSTVDEALEEEFVRFRELHPAKRLSKNIRTLLIEFLTYDGAMEANYLQDLLYDLQGLFELLEVMQLKNESEENSQTY